MRLLQITNYNHAGVELERIGPDCKCLSQAHRLRAIAMGLLGGERSEAARTEGQCHGNPSGLDRPVQ